MFDAARFWAEELRVRSCHLLLLIRFPPPLSSPPATLTPHSSPSSASSVAWPSSLFCLLLLFRFLASLLLLLRHLFVLLTHSHSPFTSCSSYSRGIRLRLICFLSFAAVCGAFPVPCICISFFTFRISYPSLLPHCLSGRASAAVYTFAIFLPTHVE